MCEIVCQLTFQMQMASVLLISSNSIDKFATDVMQTIMKWNLHFDMWQMFYEMACGISYNGFERCVKWTGLYMMQT